MQLRSNSPVSPSSRAAPTSPAQAPAEATATARSAKRPFEEAADSSSSSSSSPLAQRRQPMTQALAQTPAPASLHASHRSSRAYDTPQPGGAFARRIRSDGKAGVQSAPLAGPRRPPLLAIPPSERTEQDYHAYFQAGGTLGRIREGDRDLLCYQVAVTYEPRSLKDIPLKLKLRHPWLCLEAARRDGYAFESMPKKLLAKTSRYREMLCTLAYASPRPPRLRDVPGDLQTEARCIRSLQWAPYDLGDIPEDQITAPMCLTSLKHTPQICMPEYDNIPRSLRDGRIARALLAHDYMVQHGGPPRADWYRPGTITPAFVRDYILQCPQEIYRKNVFSSPVPLELLAEALHKYPGCLWVLQSTENISQVLLDSARASGFDSGATLPRGRWPEGVLPPDLSRLEVTRWAVRQCSLTQFSWVPADLREDEEICRSIISRGEHWAWQYTTPELLLRFSDVLLERLAKRPAQLAYLPSAVLEKLPSKPLDEACLTLLRERPTGSNLALRELAGLPQGVLTEEVRQQLLVSQPISTGEQAAGPMTLEQVPPHARTLERCERALDARGWDYHHVPPEYRSWPLLVRALRNAPQLMNGMSSGDNLVPGGLTEAMCLDVVAKLGVSPEDIPTAIRSRASFQAAVRALPTLTFNAEAFRGSIVAEFDGPDPDAFTMDWVDRLIQEDPRRACSVARFVKFDWALTAYRQGMDWEAVWDNISDPQIQKDFLAEIGPFTDSMTGPVRAARPAAESSSSSSSSSSAAAAHPS